MTKEEFIKQRCEIDKITEEEFEKQYRVVKCDCEKLRQLKKLNEEKTKIGIADHKYASKCEDKVIIMETQQKEFIKYLEDESKEVYRDGGLRQNIFRQILQKYKEIIGGKHE